MKYLILLVFLSSCGVKYNFYNLDKMLGKPEINPSVVKYHGLVHYTEIEKEMGCKKLDRLIGIYFGRVEEDVALVSKYYKVDKNVLIVHGYIQSNCGTSYLNYHHNNHFNLMFWKTDDSRFEKYQNYYMSYDNVLNSYLDFMNFIDAIQKNHLPYLSYEEIIYKIYGGKKYKNKIQKIIKAYLK